MLGDIYLPENNEHLFRYCYSYHFIMSREVFPKTFHNDDPRGINLMWAQMLPGVPRQSWYPHIKNLFGKNSEIITTEIV